MVIRGNRIEKRRLGRTGLEVSAVSLGGGAFNKPEMTAERIWRAVLAALPYGVNFLETAQDYNEDKFALSIRRAEEKGTPLIISSKSVASGYEEMHKAVKESLAKLQLKHIHIYQLQTIMSPADFKRRVERGALRALIEAKREGLISAIGISSHRIPALLEAINSGEVDVVEMPYSIGQQKSLRVLSAAKHWDVGVIAMMTLGGGMLIDRDGRGPHAKQMTVRNALSFVLSEKRVHTALVGMSSAEHVMENLEAVKGGTALNSSKRARIEQEALAILGKDFCRSCKACMPCDVFGWAFEIDNFFRINTFAEVYGYHDKYQEEYRKLPLHADACTECGYCEPRCPYDVPIVARLKEVHSSLGAGIRTDRTALPPSAISATEAYLTREVQRFKDEKRFKEAIGFMKGQLEFFSDNPVLLRNIGECYMELEEYDDAISYLLKARSIRKKTDWLHFSLGRCYFEKSEYEKALEMFKQNIECCSVRESHYHTWYYMAICHQRSRQYSEMKACLEYAKGFIEFFKKSEEYHEEQLRKFVEGWPAPFWHVEFRHLRGQGAFTEGIEFGQKQLKEYPKSSILHHYIGEFHMELEEYDKAIPYLSKAAELDQKSEWTHFDLGKCYFITGRYTDALSEMKANLRLTMDTLSHYHSRLFIAMIMDFQGNRKECKKALKGLKEQKEHLGKEIAIERQFLTRLMDEKCLPRWMSTGIKEKKKAGEWKALSREGWPGAVWHLRFRQYRRGEKYREGLKFGFKRLKEDPGSAIPYHYIGEFHMELKEYDKAIRYLSKAVELDKKMEWTHFSLGKCFYLAGRYEEAEKAFKANLELTSDRLSHFHSWIFLAMAADARNDRSGCRKALSSLKGFTEFIGQTIPIERNFLNQLDKDGRLSRWLHLKFKSQKD